MSEVIMSKSNNLSSAKTKAFGKTQLRIIIAIQEGATLNRFFENEEAVYFLEGHGEVSKDSVERLIARGALKELSDAMFGVGMSFALNADYPFGTASAAA
jgi:hypothetical protein